MTKKLFFQALIKFLLGILLVGLLIFLPAGTVYYANGWLFMGVLFIPIFIMGMILMMKDPQLLKKRLNAQEKQKEQDLVIKLSGLMFMIGFILPGLGYRFGWYILPYPISLLSAVVFLLGYLLFAEVLRENTYLSRTVEVQKTKQSLTPVFTASYATPCTQPLFFCFCLCR